MRKYAPDILWDDAWRKVVLLYLGCKLNNIECMSIKEIVNKVVIAGTTDKKLTFSNTQNVFEVQELIKFAEDYTYEKMKYLLYDGNRLKAYIIEDCKDWKNDKSLFFHLLDIIYDFEFLNEIDSADVWLALTRGVSVRIGIAAFMDYIPENSARCRFESLIQKAISDYESVIKS